MEDFLQVLQTIVSKDISSLTEYDKAFLKARSSYLNAFPGALVKFASILNIQVESELEKVAEVPAEVTPDQVMTETPGPVVETVTPSVSMTETPQAPIPQAPVKDPYDPDA